MFPPSSPLPRVETALIRNVSLVCKGNMIALNIAGEDINLENPQ